MMGGNRSRAGFRSIQIISSEDHHTLEIELEIETAHLTHASASPRVECRVSILCESKGDLSDFVGCDNSHHPFAVVQSQ